MGAGPSGPALAAQLRSYVAAFRIVGRSPDRVRESRAPAARPRTLEMPASFGVTGEPVARHDPAVQSGMMRLPRRGLACCCPRSAAVRHRPHRHRLPLPAVPLPGRDLPGRDLPGREPPDESPPRRRPPRRDLPGGDLPGGDRTRSLGAADRAGRRRRARHRTRGAVGMLFFFPLGTPAT
ncbi:hypothetical protein ACFSL4_19770 [Streptomyces caeni]|uniref:Uncharacterized protein n=1 Tax=Streptomyces caeni TaxID=2307231 RepID=A0ABW4IUC6_9ACTN